MTYFAFLALFVGIPILLLLAVGWMDRRAGRRRPAALMNWSASGGILLHCSIALLYTTPWDNYLVATGVWWYDPALVTGIVLGWVPIEEYTFFIVQPILAGLWLLALARRLPPLPLRGGSGKGSRITGVVGLTLLWTAAVAILWSGWRPGVYLALEVAWAVPPIALQWAFGGDILWRNRRLVLLSIVPLTVYLSAADAIAIAAGTWTIDPAQSTGLLLGGVLPFEEFLFFGLTNTLVTFGLVLVWSVESRERLSAYLARVKPDASPKQAIHNEAEAAQ